MIRAFCLLFLLYIGVANQAFSQDKKSVYPMPLLGGITYEIPVGSDTLWVLKNTQYKEALKISMRAQIDSVKITLLEQKLALQGDIITEKDSLIGLHNRGYIHYRDLWKTTDEKLEEERIKASKRWRFFQAGFWIGAALTIGASAYFRGL